MRQEVKDFIQSKIDLIDSNNWTQFYKDEMDDCVCYDMSDLGELTLFLMSCGCTPLEYMNKIPEGYLYGANVKTVVIPNTIQYIGYEAFAETQLESISIPESVIQLEGSVFRGCNKLKSVILESNKAHIPSDVFRHCDRLTTIIYKGTLDEWEENVDVVFDYVTVHCSDFTIEYKDGYYEDPRFEEMEIEEIEEEDD